MTDRHDARQKPPPPIFRPPGLSEYDKGFIEALQPEMRYLNTRLEFWRHCRLPRCRRGRACTGSNTLNIRDPRFPPCIRDYDDQRAYLAELTRYEAELREAYDCFVDED